MSLHLNNCHGFHFQEKNSEKKSKKVKKIGKNRVFYRKITFFQKTGSNHLNMKKKIV